jgi:16S rRNA (cytosine1402-N4)-methyltransferase
MEGLGHIPVLREEVLLALAPKAGETYIDATAGRGGHAALIALAMGTGRVVLNDMDHANLEVAKQVVRHAAPAVEVVAIRGNFATLPHELARLGIRGDMLLADLGFSSNQMDDPARGFSFQREGPLDMRLDPTLPTTAADLVNSADLRELERILEEYGEERNGRRIARKILESRQTRPIQTTGELAGLVRSVQGPPSPGIDPATRTFQALRIAVNDELGNLEAILAAIARAGHGDGWLTNGARVAVISFHSLEDRLVKRAFAELVKSGGAKEVARGCVTPGESEVSRNPRSRSAKLRAVRLGDRVRH